MRWQVLLIATSALVLLICTTASGHEEYAPGVFVRARVGYLQPTQDFSDDYGGGFVGTAGLGYFVTPAIRVEGSFMYTIPIDPSGDATLVPGDLMLLGGEGGIGYEMSPSSDATPYLELVCGYYSFGIEEEANSRESYGAFGVGAGLGLVAYPEFFSGSLDLAIHYRYVLSNEEEESAVGFLEEGSNNSFLTFTAGIGLYF
jgi:hypothetical protein